MIKADIFGFRRIKLDIERNPEIQAGSRAKKSWIFSRSGFFLNPDQESCPGY